MSAKILLAFNYGQPVALPILLLTSRLVLFRQEKHHVKVPRVERLCNAIWWLQALLSLLLVVSVLSPGLAAAGRLEHAMDWPLLQSQIACYLGVFMYFGSGLLPDPDSAFEPSTSHAHTWILAIALELASAIALRALFPAVDRLETMELSLTAIRMLILALMLCLFVVPRLGIWTSSDGDQAERASLLGNEHASRMSKPDRLPTKDAQSTGWLDYFVGFTALIPYMWPSKSPRYQIVMIVCFVLLVLQRIVNILVPFQLGVLVDELGEGRIPYSPIILYCFYRAMQGQQGLINSARAIIWIPISQLLYRRLSCDAFEHILMLSLDFHLSKRIGEVMAALSKGGALNTFLDGFAFQLFPMVFDLGVAAVYLFIYYDAFYSIIVIAVLWTYIFVTIYMAKYRGRARREMALRDREMDAAKTDSLMSYETVHHNGAVDLEISRFSSLVQRFQRAEFSVLFSLNALNAVQNCMFIFGVLLVCLLSGYQISIGEQRVSEFVALITYFAQLQAPLAFFGSFYNQVQNNLIDAERMLDLFKHRPDVVDSPKSRPLAYCEGGIRLENVSFNYATGKPALKNVSFEVKPGTTTAIVGESGSGKSTILKLLFRFYNPSQGQILFDGLETRDILMKSLRSHIGVVPQDTILFNDSIMYNLRYAKPDASDEAIHNACVAASIHHRILSFPEGYDTFVGERGLKLSGGEKQRISIARAILKDPQIMLLDEATASLDTHTEKQIQKALEDVTRDRTTVTVAHRLSTITQADQIIVLHDGRVEERGKHNELLKRNGRYRAMWDKQTLTEDDDNTS